MKINIHKFAEQFVKEYSFLYENAGSGSYVAGYREAIQEFDELVERSAAFQKLVREFCEFRHDFISSDREAAAFMFALAEIAG